MTSVASRISTFCAEREVGRVAGGVGQRAGLDDRAHPGGDAAVVAAQLEDLLDGRAVVADEVAGAAVDGRAVLRLGDLDAQATHRVGVGGAGDAAADALERRAVRAAGEAHALGDAGDGADGGVLALVAGDEEDLLLVADLDRQGHVHRREDDGVVERDQQEVQGVGHGALRGDVEVACATVAQISVRSAEIFYCAAKGAGNRADRRVPGGLPACTIRRVNDGVQGAPLFATIRRPDVIDEVFEGEAVVVNLATGVYFALNADATRVWRAVAAGAPCGPVAQEVAAETGADPAAVQAVLDAFLTDLAGHALVTLEGAASAGGPPVADVPFAPQLQAFSDMEDLLLLDPIHDIDVDGTGWPRAPAPIVP